MPLPLSQLRVYHDSDHILGKHDGTVQKYHSLNMRVMLLFLL